MATIKATIRVTKGKETANVKFRLSDGRNTQLYYTSKISVNVALWDSKKECISTRKICNTDYRRKTNTMIEVTRNRLLEVYEENKQYISTSEDLKNAIEGNRINANGLNVLKSYDICECLTAYIKEKESTISESTRLHYHALRSCLKRYILISKDMHFKCTFENIRKITESEISDFAKFAVSEYKYTSIYPQYFEVKLFDDLKRCGKIPIRAKGHNTIHKYLKDLHALFRWCISQRLLSVDPMLNYKIQSEIYGTPYYLTKQERDYITNFDLSMYPKLEVARDAFIFQCFIGCRYGDLKRLTTANVNNGYIEYVPTKTKKEHATIVRVPLHETAKRIMEKYKGKKGDFLLPIPQYTDIINDKIRRFFTLMGLNRSVAIFNSVTMQEEHKPLNEVASTHLARRTFIGLLYKQIKDPCIISSMSGHAPNSTAFARYRTIDDEIKTETIKLL